MLQGHISLIHLKEYCTFLYKNHLKEFAAEDLKRNKELNVPLLKHFAHLPDEELTALSEKGVKEFLLNLIEDKAISITKESIKNWKEDRLPGIARDQIMSADIVLLYNARKHTLFKFLSKYSKSPEEIIAIVNEIENFYTFQESLAIQAFAEIKQAEIKENEKRLHEAQELADLGNWEYNLTTGKTYWSPHLYKIYGLDVSAYPKGISAKEAESLINKDDVAGLRDKIMKAAETLGTYNYEVAITRPDGENRFLYNVGHVEKNEKGEIVVKGISQDVTERKINEEGSRQKDLFISHIAQSSPDFIHIFDIEEKKFVYANKEITALLGFTHVPLEKKVEFLDSLIHPDDEHILINRKKKFETIADNEIIEDELRLKNAEGNWIWLNFRGLVFKRNQKGKVAQIIGITRDITKDKINQEKLIELNKFLNNQNEELTVLQEELQATNEELMENNLRLDDKVRERTQQLENKNIDLVRINSDLDNFIYTASHDLKAPVSNIEGLIVTLKDALSSENPLHNQSIETILDMIDRSITRFKGTIHDLTEISKAQKVEDGTIEEIYCLEIIEDVKEDIQSLIVESGATININLENCGSIKFSPKNFKSIIYNLLSNAIKYRDPKRSPIISINYEKIPGFVKLTFKDNGLGINSGNIPKMFTMFKRFHDHVEGSGVGLYIVKRILDNAGGHIEVDSEQGKGTTFRVYIKVENEPANKT